MKKVLRTIAFVLFYIYVGVGAFVAFPYSNWRYAQEHGFMRWLLFGEVVATAKATIWPYYAVVGIGPGRTSADSSIDAHFANSRRASYEALKIIDQFGGIMELPPDAASKVVRLLQASVTEAELVDDSYLQRVHPEFLRRFREDYTGSLRNLADGIATGDRAKQDSAATAYNDFSDWVGTHAKEINF